jgi:hypothetical protein
MVIESKDKCLDDQWCLQVSVWLTNLNGLVQTNELFKELLKGKIGNIGTLVNGRS